MDAIPRTVEPRLRSALGRGRSVLLLERAPLLLGAEVEALAGGAGNRTPLIALDEVQRVPALVDVVEDVVDRRVARFVLTGSSARKLRRGGDVNLLPGRLLPMRLDPLSLAERVPPTLEEALVFGSLPAIALEPDAGVRDEELRAYTTLYLEEEVRAEALVRNLGTFSRFLQLAALESGGISHFRGIAQELGIAHSTVAGYYGILEDCLIAERVEPISESRTRKKLTKSSRYLFFDLGVRRAAADEGSRLPVRVLGALFEQYVGLEILRATRSAPPGLRLQFWRDPDGPKVDWVVCSEDRKLPVEVRWSTAPTERDARHLRTFLAETPQARDAVVVCRTPRRFRLDRRITAVPWQEIPQVVASLV